MDGWKRIGALALAAALAFAGMQAELRAGPGAHTNGHCKKESSDGPKHCNCTSTEASVELCHSETVTLKIGNNTVGNVATGQSSSTCWRDAIESGQCKWIRYRFLCCKGLFGWKCNPLGNSLHEGPAGPGDCS